MSNTPLRDPSLEHGGGKGETKTFFHNNFSSGRRESKIDLDKEVNN